MLLSFSVPEMRPWVETGVMQLKAGPNFPGDWSRVKRQTIRQRGPRADRLLSQAKDGKHPGLLHLWWKSRTKERALLGVVEGYRIYRIEITHDETGVFMRGPMSWRGDQFSSLGWSPEKGGKLLTAEARADGFDSVEAFRDYFVPNRGDRFDGVLYKW